MQQVLDNQDAMLKLLQHLAITTASASAGADVRTDAISVLTDAAVYHRPATVTCDKLTNISPPGMQAPLRPVPTVSATASGQFVSSSVGAKRPRLDTAASFLPQAPTIVTYKQSMSSYDIADVFHDALRMGYDVNCEKKQDRSRLRTVVAYAKELLKTEDQAIKALQARLSRPPPPQSSPDWSSWTKDHKAACLDLKAAVQNALCPEGWPAVWTTTVCAVGSRMEKLEKNARQGKQSEADSDFTE